MKMYVVYNALNIRLSIEHVQADYVHDNVFSPVCNALGTVFQVVLNLDEELYINSSWRFK